MVIYMTGGLEYDSRKVIHTCLRYDIKTNCWKNVPKLSRARGYHSSCAVGTRIFVFGGSNGIIPINSIETLSVVADLNDGLDSGLTRWDLIEVPFNLLLGRSNTLAIQISHNSILIMGGMSFVGQLGDVCIFNTDER